MLHAHVLPRGSLLTGSSPLPKVVHGLSSQELVAVQRDIQACQATLVNSRQQCRDASDLLAFATKRIARSRHFLASSR